MIETKETNKDENKTGDNKVEVPSLEAMLKAGVHFGHRTSKWNARMKPFIFASRNDVHIIDLEQTQEKLKQALEFIKETKEKKGKILFVGTKVAAKDITQQTAEGCGMPYVADRWIGGTLTNFKAISNRLRHFRDLEKAKKAGELSKYTKKEQHEFDIELEKLRKRFGGIKEMTELPTAIFVLDVFDDKTAIREAKAKKIPIIGLCDTNASPEDIDYLIPANDDAISSLQLILEAVKTTLKC